MQRVALLFGLPILLGSAAALGQPSPSTPQDPGDLGEFLVTGTHVEKAPKLAVLPSLSPDLEDVIVRSAVRHDFELSGMFEVLSDSKAPNGSYRFDDPVDVAAWRKTGAEVVVKVAARKVRDGRIEILGVAYFLTVSPDPIFQRTYLSAPEELRITAHRVTDALLGAVTGRPGGFASHFSFSTPWGRARRIFTMDADGENLVPVTSSDATAIAPTWGPDGLLFFSQSVRYSPYRLQVLAGAQPQPVGVPFTTSIYASSVSADGKKLALAVAEQSRSYIRVGALGGTDFAPVSKTELATSPAFSPSGKLAWIGGGNRQGTQRVFVDGSPVSPAGYTAAAPTFCDTEDGIRLVYAVAVGNDRMDLVMSDEKGRGLARLTQGQGSNYAPACSPDGRLLAFFSTRKGSPGLMLMSLKRFTTIRVNGQLGDSLSWARLPKSSTLTEMTPPHR